MNAEEFVARAQRLLDAYRSGRMCIQPDVLIVPTHLEAVARRELNKKRVKQIGNYTLWQYEGEQWWQRNSIWGDCRTFPRWIDMGWMQSSLITTNRHWRKRGYPAEMKWSPLTVNRLTGYTHN